MKKDLKGSEVAELLIWNKVHNIIYYMSMTLSTLVHLIFITIQIIALGVFLTLKGIGASESVIHLYTYVGNTIVILSSVFVVLTTFITSYTKDKAIEGLDTLNDYTKILKNTLKEEMVNGLQEGNGSFQEESKN